MTTNNIKEIQEFVRKEVIMATEPKGRYEDSIDLLYPESLYDYEAEVYQYREKVDYDTEKCHYRVDVNKMLINEIAPRISLTLARVLNALKLPPIYNVALGANYLSFYKHTGFVGQDKRFNWQFLNKGGSEATFLDQTEETQIAIAKLLGWEGVA